MSGGGSTATDGPTGVWGSGPRSSIAPRSRRPRHPSISLWESPDAPASGSGSVPADQVMAVAEREGATPHDVMDVELGHHGEECSFDALIKKYELTGDPALLLLARIVNGADTDNSLWNPPESAGLRAVAEGFRWLGFEDDHQVNAAGWIVFDALYDYCQRMVQPGRLDDGSAESGARAMPTPAGGRSADGRPPPSPNHRHAQCARLGSRPEPRPIDAG